LVIVRGQACMKDKKKSSGEMSTGSRNRIDVKMWTD
jgi:hypothetical protein